MRHDERCPECGGWIFDATGRWLVCVECGIGADQDAWTATALAWDEDDGDPQGEAEAVLDAMEGIDRD